MISGKSRKAQDIVYQRLKRSKQLFWQLICEEIDSTVPLLAGLWQPLIDSQQQAQEVCRRYLQRGFPDNVLPAVIQQQ